MKSKALEWFGVVTAIMYSMLVAFNIGVEFTGFLLLLVSAFSIGYWAYLGRHKEIPKSGLKININECYIHCGKAIRRSKIWSNEMHIKKGTFPSIGKIIKDQLAPPGMTVEDLDNFAEEAYKNTLY